MAGVSAALAVGVCVSQTIAGGDRLAFGPDEADVWDATVASLAFSDAGREGREGSIDTLADALAAAKLSPAATPTDETSLRFGDEGWRGWSVQGGAATSGVNLDANLRLGLHEFLADNFEVTASLGVWGHDQDGDNAASINAGFGFRYHVVNNVRVDGPARSGLLPDGWTAYADMGIGMMYATSDVPDDGTRYNFTPRIGVGFTLPLSDRATRLDLGVRWQHFSNASTAGSDENPARDEVMLYIGLISRF
jgi:hypothetical protein